MNSEHTEFSSGDVEKIVDLKRSRLHSWRERGWLTASVHKGEGSGSKNIYDRFDLYKIAMFKRLVGEGFSRKLTASYFQSITDIYSMSPKDWYIDIIEFWIWGCEGEEIFPTVITMDHITQPVGNFLNVGFRSNEIMHLYDSVFFLNFRKIREAIDSKIKEIKG